MPRNRIYYDESYTKEDLKYVCRVEGISGYSRLNKTNLLTLVNNWFNQKRRCNAMLSREIAKNIKEFNERRMYISRKQAIAVAYTTVRNKIQNCNRIYD